MKCMTDFGTVLFKPSVNFWCPIHRPWDFSCNSVFIVKCFGCDVEYDLEVIFSVPIVKEAGLTGMRLSVQANLSRQFVGIWEI